MNRPMREQADGDSAMSVDRDRPKLWQALIPVLALISFLAVNIFAFGGDPHIPLILAAAVAGAMGSWLGYDWRSIQQGIAEGISVGLTAILILMVIGIMIGTWIASGVVPTLIYYGLELLHPGFFLAAACAVCAVVSIATGSSWTTAGTVGIALIGIGSGLGVPTPMVAGAIVSGAYFGDKMSPLSDTTNLAPAVAGAELFEHIRHMLSTTVPALIIALILYTLLGLFYVSGQPSVAELEVLRTGLAKEFTIHPALMIPPALVILMVILRVPALPALFAGALIGAICALAFQTTSVADMFRIAKEGYVSETGIQAVDDLLTNGGLDSMMPTVALILASLTFGGIMERTRMLQTIAAAILRLAHSTGTLVLATIGTCVGMNVIAPDQYLSIIVPGRMYRHAFEKRNLQMKNLSRALEDGGTLTSPLVPWNTCGAFMFSTLGVFPLAYLPFAFLNLLSPLISILYGFTGWTIARTEPKPSEIPSPVAQSL